MYFIEQNESVKPEELENEPDISVANNAPGENSFDVVFLEGTKFLYKI